MTKYIICLGDGMADHPIKDLGNKTPLEVANTPNIDAISTKGVLGMVDTVPPGFNPGSDVANMGILGFDPAQYYTGRGPIEAASMGVKCADNEMIFRCNLVSIVDNLMKDFTSDHISTQESTQLINELNIAFQGTAVRFIAGVSYRHIMVAPDKFAALATVAPHDILDQSVDTYWPQGELMDEFFEIIKTANNVLATSQIDIERQQTNKGEATSIWPWIKQAVL